MTKLQKISGKILIKTLKKVGFKVIRVKGSHHFLHHDDGRCTVVPVHGSEVIGTGLMLKIIRDIELTKEEFIKLV